MPKSNWLGRLSAHLWNREFQPRRRRGGSLGSTVPAMIEVLEPRRVLSGASVTNLAFAPDAAMPGMMTAHGQITGTVTGVTPGGSETAWVEIDRYGDGSVDGMENVNGDSFSHEADASFGANLFKIRVVVSDAVEMTITSGNWQDFAFNVSPPANAAPAVTNLSFTVDRNSSGMVFGHLEGGVDDDGTSPLYEIQIDRNDDGSPDESDTAFGSSPIQFTHSNMSVVVGSNTLKVRAIEWDAATMMPLEGDWVALTFNVDPPPNTPPTVDQLVFSPGAASIAIVGRPGSITGQIHDDMFTHDDYLVQVDDDGDGVWDARAYSSREVQFSVNTNYFELGNHTVRVRAIEIDDQGNEGLAGDWVDLTFEITNRPPAFASGSATIDVETFVGDEIPLPKATDPDRDSVFHMMSAPPTGTEFVYIDLAPYLRVVDGTAFRSAVATGGTYTLTAEDSFGDTGTMQIKFRLAAGSTVTASATATPILINRINWDDSTRTVVTSPLGTANVTVSAVTETNPLTGGLRFQTPTAPMVNLGWVDGSIVGEPWTVLAGLPTVTSTGNYPNPDGVNETLIVVVSQVVKVMDGNTVVARIPYDIVFTLSTTGATSTSIWSGSPTIDPAYSPRRVVRPPSNLLAGILLGTAFLTADVDLR